MKNFTAVKKSKEQATYLEDHPVPDTVGVALDKLSKGEKKASQYIYLSGRGVSGNLILRSNVLKYDRNAVEKELKEAMDISEEAKVKLIQRNKYTQPKLFNEKKFGEDVEGQNFFLMEDQKDK
jgi:hypothetical protein